MYEYYKALQHLQLKWLVIHVGSKLKHSKIDRAKNIVFVVFFCMEIFLSACTVSGALISHPNFSKVTILSAPSHTHLGGEQLEVWHINGLHEWAIAGHPNLHCVLSEGQHVGRQVSDCHRLRVPRYLHGVVGSVVVKADQLAGNYRKKYTHVYYV